METKRTFYTKDPKETDKISWMHNEEGVLVEFDTGYIKKKKNRGRPWTSLSEWMTEHGMAGLVKGKMLLSTTKDSLWRIIVAHILKGHSTCTQKIL